MYTLSHVYVHMYTLSHVYVHMYTLSHVADTSKCTYTRQAGGTSRQAVGKGIQKGARQVFQGAERQRQKDGASARCRAASATRERRARAGGAVGNGFGCGRSRRGYQVDAVAACCSVLQCVAERAPRASRLCCLKQLRLCLKSLRLWSYCRCSVLQRVEVCCSVLQRERRMNAG